MNDKNYSVTVLGSSGFIGSNLVRALAEKGRRVTAFDKYPFPGGFENNLITEVTGDFFNEGILEEILSGCDLCFHLISTTLPSDSNLDPHFDAQSNIGGALQLLNAAVRQGVKKVVFSSSGGTVYGPPSQVPISETHPTEPICSYGVTKLAIEKYMALYNQLHGLNTCCLRLANPYGPGQKTTAVQGAIAVFLGKVLRGEAINVWGDGQVVRDYIYIADAAEAMILAGDSGPGFSLYNIGSGSGHSLNEILAAIAKVTGREPEVVYEAPRGFDVPSNILDITKAVSSLGWRPRTSLEEGLKLTWAALSRGC